MSGATDTLQQTWSAQWHKALACWSRFTRLREPCWCHTKEEERREGLTSSFAMIRLTDKAVVISLRQLIEYGLENFPLEVMAHEIGHHVYCPADLTDQGRLLASIRAGLPGYQDEAPFIANLYADLMINNRLQRRKSLDIAGVYRALATGEGDALWSLYIRIYELLWGCSAGHLAGTATLSIDVEGDARLGSRLIRNYAKHWLDGAGRFARLCLPYLEKDQARETRRRLAIWIDTNHSGNQIPNGLTRLDAAEIGGTIHPAFDPALNDALNPINGAFPGRARIGGQKKTSRYRDVADYGELLRALGQPLEAEQVAMHYYRERALPHLISFPVRPAPQGKEPQPEGLEAWEPGSPLDRLDWLHSTLTNPYVIPGVTTVQRTEHEPAGDESTKHPPDLYIGIDCSGSMPNPQRQMSCPALAGTILALSALRGGARVKVVLSGEPGQTLSTESFTRNEDRILQVLVAWLGTGYAFGIHRLDDTFIRTQSDEHPVHLLLITDQDIFSMLDDTDERTGNRTGWSVAAQAQQQATAATCVLHMPTDWEDDDCQRLTAEGWDVHRVYDHEELIDFARHFSRQQYEVAR